MQKAYIKVYLLYVAQGSRNSYVLHIYPARLTMDGQSGATEHGSE